MEPPISRRYRLSSTPEWAYDCLLGGGLGLFLWGVPGAVLGAIFGGLVGQRPGARRRQQEAKLRHLQLRSAARRRAAAKAAAVGAVAERVEDVPRPPAV